MIFATEEFKYIDNEIVATISGRREERQWGEAG